MTSNWGIKRSRLESPGDLFFEKSVVGRGTSTRTPRFQLQRRFCSEGMSPELEVRVLLVPGLPPLVVKAAGVKPLEEKSCRFKMEDVSFCNCECLPKGSQRYLDNPGSARHCLCILVNVYVPLRYVHTSNWLFLHLLIDDR